MHYLNGTRNKSNLALIPSFIFCQELQQHLENKKCSINSSNLLAFNISGAFDKKIEVNVMISIKLGKKHNVYFCDTGNRGKDYILNQDNLPTNN